MAKCTITPKDAQVALAAGRIDNARMDLQQVVVADGLIQACNGFILAWRKLYHEGNMVIHKSLLAIKKDTAFHSTSRNLVKQTDTEMTIVPAKCQYGETEAQYLAKMKVLQIKPTEDHRRIALDKKVLLQMLSCFPDSKKGAPTVIQLFVPSSTTQPVIMHCNETHGLMMPLLVEWRKDDW